MHQRTHLAALILSALALVVAVWVGVDAWSSQSSVSLFLAFATAVQAVCLLLTGLRRRLHIALLALVLAWSISSGALLPFAAVKYAINHGVEGLMGGAGASGFIDTSGSFHSATPPLPGGVFINDAVFLNRANCFRFGALAVCVTEQAGFE